MQSHRGNFVLIANSLEGSSILEEQKKTILSRASDSSDEARYIINNLENVCSKGVPALDRAFNNIRLGISFAQVEMNPSQLASFTRTGLRTLQTMTSPVTGALGLAALGSTAVAARHLVSSKTLIQSLINVREDFSHHEVGSFDANESSPDRLARRMKRTCSSRF